MGLSYEEFNKKYGYTESGKSSNNKGAENTALNSNSTNISKKGGKLGYDDFMVKYGYKEATKQANAPAKIKSTAWNPSYKADNPLTTQYNNTVGKVSKVQSWLNNINTKLNGKAEDKTVTEQGKTANKLYSQEKKALADAQLAAAYDVTDGMSSAKALKAQEQKTAEAGVNANTQKNTDKGNYYSSILNNKDLMQKGIEGSNKYNANADVVGKNENPGNKIEWAKAHKDDLAEITHAKNRGDVFEEYRGLNYVTTEENAIYNYLLATEGEKSADAFLDYIRPTLNSRVGQEVASNIAQKGTVGRYGNELLLSAVSGLEGGVTSIAQNLSEEAKPYTANEMANMYVGEDINKRHEAKGNADFNLEKLTVDAVNTIANMVPAITVGTLTGGAGGSIVGGLSARGATYRQLLNEGYTAEQADSVATIVGVAEGVTQYLLSGVSAIGGKVTGLSAEKLTGKIASPIARAVAELGIDATGETIEEILQNKIQAVAENSYLGTNNSLAPNSEDLYTAAISALTTVILQTPAAIRNAKYNPTVIGKSIRLNNMADSLIEVAKTSSNADTRTLATNLENGNAKMTDEQIGKLANDVEAQGFNLAMLENAENRNTRIGTEQAINNANANINNAEYTKAAQDILNNPNALKSFEAQYGKVEGTSKTEQVKNLSAMLYSISQNAQQTENVDTTPQAPNPLTNATNPMAMPEPTMSANQSYVRGLIMNSEADEILSNPEYIAIYEELTGKTLPRKADGTIKTDAARLEIMQNSRSVYDGENTLLNRAVDINQSTANPLAENGTKTTVGEQNNSTQQITQPTTENATQVVEPRVSANPLTTNATTSAKTVADLETAKQIHRQMPTLEPETKVTGNSENVATNNLMPDDFREEIKNNPDLYTVDHNKDTLAKAIEIRDTKGLQGAIDTIQEWIVNGKNGMKLPLEAAPLSKIIVAELYKAENRNSVTEGIARQINADIGAELAYAGKFGQANAILRNTDPLTRQQTFQKYIDMINKTIKENFGKRYKYRAELTEAEIAKIETLDMSSDSAMEDMLSEIYTRVGREMPSTLWQKFLGLTKTGMLTLPATHAGNFAANVPTAGLRILNNFFSGGMQKLGSTVTKLVDAEIPVQNENGTWTAKVNGKELTYQTKEECTAYAKAEKFGQTRASFYGSEHRGIAKQVYDEVKNDLGKGSNKWETGKKVLETQTIIKPIKAFKEWGQNNADALNKMITDKFGKDAEQIFDASATQSFMNFISWAMEQEDKPFVKWAFVDSLASYCKARGINSVEQVTNEAIAHATVDAMYYTYKNTNAISQVVQQIKRGGSKGEVVDTLGDAMATIGEVKMPFVNTLANIGIMAVEHNPFVAFAKAGAEAGLGASGTQIADTIAKGFTGGLVIALGALLRATGLMTGDEDEDYNKAQWLKASGQMPNSILGKWDISQFQPISNLMSFGANLWDNFTENKDDKSILQLTVDAMWQSADGIWDMEMLQNMSELFGSNDDYADEGKTQAFIDSFLVDLPSRVFPNLWRGSINAADDTNRYYKYGDGIGEKILNALKYVSGFGREDLAENVNVKGTSNKGDRATTIFDSILYPGQIGQGEQTKFDNYLSGLEKEFGDKTMYPTKFKPNVKYKNDNGDEITVGYDEVGQFQKTYSKTYLNALDKMMKSTDFNNLDTTAKKTALSELKSFALDVAKAEAFKNEGLSYTSNYQDIIKGDDEKGIPALGIDKAMDYFMFKKSFDSSVTTGNYKAIDNAVGKFENLNSDIKKALFAKDTDIKALVNAADYDITAKDYYSYKNALNNAADQRNLSKTGSVAKMYAIAEAGLDDATISNIISNNAFGLSATSLAVIEVLTQEPYSLPLEDAAKFLYETDYTVNDRYKENDIIDMGKDSVNEETRKFAKALELGHEEVNDENLQKLYDELLMEDANMTGVIGGKANGTLSNLEVANSLSASDNPILSNNATAIYNALRDKLSNYYNDWGGYSYQSEVDYLPKSYAKGYVYGRKTVDTTNNLTKSAKRGR